MMAAAATSSKSAMPSEGASSLLWRRSTAQTPGGSSAAAGQQGAPLHPGSALEFRIVRSMPGATMGAAPMASRICEEILQPLNKKSLKHRDRKSLNLQTYLQRGAWGSSSKL